MQKQTILNLWKKEFSKNKGDKFLWDNVLGMQTKRDFILKAYFISGKIKKIEGDYIGIMLPAVGGASLLIIATYLAGKIPVMFNWTLGKEAFNHCVQFSKVYKIISVASFYDRVSNDFLEEHNKDGRFIFLEDLLKNGSKIEKISALVKSFYLPLPSPPLTPPSKGGEQKKSPLPTREGLGVGTAVILFTSGSESLPKAVALTHENLIEDIKGSLELFPISNKNRLIGFLPPFHSFGFTLNTILPLISGLQVVYTPDPNDARTILNIIKHTKVDCVTATPTFLKMIMSLASGDDLKRIKYACVGAEKCGDDIFDKFEELCPEGVILEGYGITECSPVVSLNCPEFRKRGTVGKVIGSLDIKIVDVNDPIIINNKRGEGKIGEPKFNEVKQGEQGMIYLSGPSIFGGYLDDKIESPFEEVGGNKYYKTGDLGLIDDEGFLHITGRLKRFIKIAGEMISLPFIEGVLLKKYGNDEEVKIAIEAQEKDGNAKFVLFTVEEIEVEEVNDYLRKNGVSNLVKISEVIKVEEIPVLGTGKIDYKVLKGMIKNDKKKVNYDFSDIEGTLKLKLHDLNNIDISKIKNTSVFGKDIHLDSIDVGELIIFIRKNYKIESEIKIIEIKTFKDLVNIVQNNKK